MGLAEGELPGSGCAGLFSAEALRLPAGQCFVRARCWWTPSWPGSRFYRRQVVPISVSGNCDDNHFAGSDAFRPDALLANSERQFAVGGDILSSATAYHCVGSRLGQGRDGPCTFSEFLDRVARIEPVGSPAAGRGFHLQLAADAAGGPAPGLRLHQETSP